MARLVMAVLLVAVACARVEAAGPKIGPSEHAGKGGTYQMKTSKAGNNYWVYVPKSYSGENPAGVHLFFHGQHGQKGAEWFGQWAKEFLEPQNLIGINMQFEDGDNMKDPGGKVMAAEEALAQTRADYKVMPGRGVVGSFSGGGIPHGMMMLQFGKNRSAEWPFVHSAAYDSNFRIPARGAVVMSWFIGLGGKEWTIAGAGLGASQTGLMTALLQDAGRGGSPDLYLRIEKDKGHSISDADVAASAAAFHRSDLAMCGFVWSPDFAEPELKGIAEAMNSLALGRAAGMLTALKGKKEVSAEVGAKAGKLQEKLDARVAAVMALTKQLAEEDPVLLAYYSRIFERQLSGHEKAKEFAEIVSAGKKAKGYGETLAAFEGFVQRHGGMFVVDQPKLTGAAAGWLGPVAAGAPEKSLVGRMAREYLELK